jgi:hypothetical protein
MEQRWISAFDAHSRMEKHGEYEPALVILPRAADGVVVVRARFLLWGRERQEDCEIPPAFWAEIISQNWRAGDFSSVVRSNECRAYGVTFLEADIEAMLPRKSGLGVEQAEDGFYAPAGDCLMKIREQIGCERKEAEAQIVRLCQAGLIASRCATIRWRCEDGSLRSHHEAEDVAVPDWFWLYCTVNSGTVLDWVSGTFAGSGTIGGATYFVKATGVKLDVQGVLALEAMLMADAADGDTAHANPTSAAPGSIGGRPRTEKWSVWTAELAAFIHEEGIPAGAGVEGQDAVIAAIDVRLNERGLEGPSRSTVQPVVRAVLRRLRSAEN